MRGRSDLVHTYSIIAYDSDAGVMGGAVQSHYFSVGGTVIWAEAGSGVIATQAMVNMDYGPRGLAMLKDGKDARAVIENLTGEDEAADVRQAAALDVRGGISAFTGGRTIREAGHRTGRGYSVQANMMLRGTVPDAMAHAFEKASGELSERFLMALKAAEGEGGDIRGRQSAAMLIVPIEDRGCVRENFITDLRVEDSPSPLAELERLMRIDKAYRHADNGDLAIEKGDLPSAMEEFGRAEALLPGNPELRFWKAVALLNTGLLDEAEAIFSAVFKADAHWKELLLRLPDAGIVNNESSTIQFLNKYL